MTQSVEFATAKLAKEKRYDEVTTGRLGFSLYNEEGQKITSCAYFERERNTCFLRPTQEELQTWLREKHRIHLSVSPWKDEMNDAEPEANPKESFQVLYEGNVIDVDDDWNTFSDFSYHHSYEECLEALLIEGLNLIK